MALTLTFVFFLGNPVYVATTNQAVPSWIGFLIGICAGAHFAVGWHRSVLLGEKKPRILRLGFRELKYFLVWFVIVFFLSVVDYLIPSVDTSSGLISVQNYDISAIVALLLVVVIATGCLAAIYMVAFLPGIAIDDRRMTPLRAWRSLKGNRWRFLWLIVITGVFFSLALYGSMTLGGVLRLPTWEVLGAIETDSGRTTLNIAPLVLAEFLLSIPFLAVLFPVFAAFVGSLSMAYAGIAKQALRSEEAYEPSPEFRRRLAI